MDAFTPLAALGPRVAVAQRISPSTRRRALLGQLVLALVGLTIICCYAWVSGPSAGAGDQHYNRLVDGFRSGQLSLKVAMPPGLARLSDPYDPSANFPYRSALYDMSYYRGKLYLYFGATPALLLFWPWVALSGHYLSQALAVVICSAVGFLASAFVLRAAWRRYFPQTSAGVIGAGVLALGLCSGVRVLLQRPSVWEVPIACGYALVFLAFIALWQALHQANSERSWAALASGIYGLAIGARPVLIFGALVLLVPAAKAFFDSRRAGQNRAPVGLLIAGGAPCAVIVCAVLGYNFRRFGNPFEFGLHYQLLSFRQDQGQELFSPHYLWYNLRLYFLQPIRWHGEFPFAGSAVPVSPLPAGHAVPIEGASGVLSNFPVTCLALLAPLASRGGGRAGLAWFLGALALCFAASALTLLFFFGSLGRYEVDFLPALLLLAVFGVLGLEAQWARGGTRRLVARSAWITLLAFSVSTSVLGTAARRKMQRDSLTGRELLRAGRYEEAIAPLQAALGVEPDLAHLHTDLAVAFQALGRYEQAGAECESALRIEPDLRPVRLDWARCLLKTGRTAEAAAQLAPLVRADAEDSVAREELRSLSPARIK